MKNINEMAQQLQKLIIEHDRIIILRHINPDGDAMGSQWGLKTIINDNFANKQVFAPGDTTDEMRKFYPEPDKVNPEQYVDALVIICDTANRERISAIGWELAKTIVKIDHHPEIDHYETVTFVDSNAPATCQLVAQFAQLLALKLSQLAARYLFFGLVTDSGRFLHADVNWKTFLIAAYLAKTEFNMFDLYNNLYQQNLQSLLIKGYILNHFEVSKNGVAYLICDKEQLLALTKKMISESSKNYSNLLAENVKITREDFTKQTKVMAHTVGIKIWMIACQDHNKPDYKVSVRSNYHVINTTLQKFGGGGHKLACGTNLSSRLEVKQLLQELDKVASMD